jgi:NAD(P)-dependent dehydrogenase (short-subunit alcohol dehydrogenase family)
MSGRLLGQRVIVLGASSGIGLAVAREALREDAEVLIIPSQMARIEKALAQLGGLIATNLWQGMSEQARGQLYADAGDKLLVGRVGSAEDVAAAYLFLMTSGFATGQVHTVDGGALLI